MARWTKKEENVIKRAIKLMEKSGLMVEVDLPGETMDDNVYRIAVSKEDDW